MLRFRPSPGAAIAGTSTVDLITDPRIYPTGETSVEPDVLLARDQIVAPADLHVSADIGHLALPAPGSTPWIIAARMSAASPEHALQIDVWSNPNNALLLADPIRQLGPVL